MGMSSRDPEILSAEDAARRRADRLNALFVDADLRAIGHTTSGLGALAPLAETAEAERAVVDFVLGVLRRAGYLDVFRTLTALDALGNGDHAVARLLGCVEVEEPVPGEPPLRHWTLPGGPRVRDPEAVARELAQRLVAREAARREGGSP